MRTFQDIRDKIDSLMLPDFEGNVRLYNYVRYRPEEMEREAGLIDRRIRYAAEVLGTADATDTWLRQARLALASEILMREIESWDEVRATEHIQILLWACRSSNLSGLWSWLRRYEATLAER